MSASVFDTAAVNDLLKDGSYIAVVADFKPRLLADPRCDWEAIRFTLKIVEGDSRNRLPTVELLLWGPAIQKARVRHDLSLLDRWRHGLGLVEPAPTWPDAIEECRAAAIGKRVEFTLWQKIWNGRVEVRLSSVRVLGDG